MQSKGYSFSWGQVSSKMDSLKRRYKKIKDASKQSGNGRMPKWEFYEVSKRKCLVNHRKTYNLIVFTKVQCILSYFRSWKSFLDNDLGWFH